MHDFADLLEAAQAGDGLAVSRLISLSQPDLRRYARYVCHADDVDDAVQDALVIVHRRIGGLRRLSALSAWLFAIVRRECSRLARRGLSRHRDIEDFADDLSLSVRPDHELRLDLARGIQSLPMSYRQVVLLRDMTGLTIAEIAAVTDTTRAAVKARLHRARDLLREYLGR